MLASSFRLISEPIYYGDQGTQVDLVQYQDQTIRVTCSAHPPILNGFVKRMRQTKSQGCSAPQSALAEWLAKRIRQQSIQLILSHITDRILF